MKRVRNDTFTDGIDPYWERHLVGTGAVSWGVDGARFTIRDASSQVYSDAQLDDYEQLRRAELPWRPPLTLDVRARFSHQQGQLRGTAGFGFWNHPILLPRERLPALPRAIWFFYASPPSDMQLDSLVPGFGWKAATIDASRWSFLALAPVAPLAFPLMHIPVIARALWPIGQVALGVREAPILADMRAWHRYTLRWERNRARFWVDGALLLDSAFSPAGPLGIVLWIDNQYAIVTPQGRFGGGFLDAPGEQWLEVAELRIEK